MDLSRGRDVLRRYHDAVLMGVARKGVFRNEGFLTPDDFSVCVKTIGSETPVNSIPVEKLSEYFEGARKGESCGKKVNDDADNGEQDNHRISPFCGTFFSRSMGDDSEGTEEARR